MGCRVSSDRNRVYVMDNDLMPEEPLERNCKEIERVFEHLNHTGQGVHIENFSELHLRCTGEDFNFVQVERALKAIAANISAAAPPKYISLEGYKQWLETRENCRRLRISDSEALRNGAKEEGVFSNIDSL